MPGSAPRPGAARSFRVSVPRFCLYFSVMACLVYTSFKWTSFVMSQTSTRPRIVPTRTNGSAVTFRYSLRLLEKTAITIAMQTDCSLEASTHRVDVANRYTQQVGRLCYEDAMIHLIDRCAGSFKEIYLTKEIVQRQDVGQYNDEVISCPAAHGVTNRTILLRKFKNIYLQHFAFHLTGFPIANHSYRACIS